MKFLKAAAKIPIIPFELIVTILKIIYDALTKPKE